MKAVTVARGTSGSVRLEEVPEPDVSLGSVLVERWRSGSAALMLKSLAVVTGGRHPGTAG
jgi:hypothetical protein